MGVRKKNILRGQDSHGASRLWMPRSPLDLRAFGAWPCGSSGNPTALRASGCLAHRSTYAPSALGLAGALAIPRRFAPLDASLAARPARLRRLVLRELWQSHRVLILPPTFTNKQKGQHVVLSFLLLHCGGRIRTCGLRVMSPTRCHFSTPRYKERTRNVSFQLIGDYLLSQAVSSQVPSAM